MLQIRVECPNHDNAIRWVEHKNITLPQMDMIIQRLALKAEAALRSILQTETFGTGATAGSIETWKDSMSATHVSYKVGSRMRGNILFWLDQGRGWVYPLGTGMRRLYGQRLGVLRFEKNGEIVYTMYSRPAPAKYVMMRAATVAFAELDQIVKEVLD